MKLKGSVVLMSVQEEKGGDHQNQYALSSGDNEYKDKY